MSERTLRLIRSRILPAERRSGSVAARQLVVVAIAAIVCAEAMIAFVGPLAGAVFDAAIVATLAWHRQILWPRGAAAAPESIGLAALALALLPIARLLSLTVPSRDLSELTWYELVGAPILAVLAWLCWIDVDLRRLARNVGVPRVQIAIALSGVPLGLLGYLIAREAPLETGADIVLAIPVLIVFTGVAEELLFRGALTVALERVGGPFMGLIGATVLFAAFHLDVGHPAYVPFAAAYGLGFGLAARRTGSLAGVALAHGLLNVGLLLVWPNLL